MQVNQSTSPNFGQLKVVKSDQVTKALRSERIENLTMIKKVGEKLKDTQFYNLLIKYDSEKGSLLPKLESTADAYFGIFKSERFKNITFNHNTDTMLIDSVYGIKKHLSNTVGMKEYDIWGVAGYQYDHINDIDCLSDLVLELDKAAIKNYNEKIAAEKAALAYQKEVDDLTNNILADFGS